MKINQNICDINNNSHLYHRTSNLIHNKTTAEAYVSIYDPRKSTSYSDQTGRFPVRSYKGMNYIMVLFENTSNYIFAEAMKDRTEQSMITAFNNIQKQPNLTILIRNQ